MKKLLTSICLLFATSLSMASETKPTIYVDSVHDTWGYKTNELSFVKHELKKSSIADKYDFGAERHSEVQVFVQCSYRRILSTNPDTGVTNAVGFGRDCNSIIIDLYKRNSAENRFHLKEDTVKTVSASKENVTKVIIDALKELDQNP